MAEGYRPRIVVSGSRTWGVISDNPKLGSPSHIARPERAIAVSVLNHFLGVYGHDLILVHGNARGLDRLAAAWATERALGIEPHPVSQEDWKRDGMAAGMFRNAQMIEARTEVVVAFIRPSTKTPDAMSEGTSGMIKMTRKRGIPILVYRSPFWPEMSDPVKAGW